MKLRLQGMVFPLSFLLLAAVLPTARSERHSGSQHPCLRWEIKEGAKANRARGERLYRAACRWVEENMAPDDKPVRPCVTIKVGKPCPNSKRRACLEVDTRTIYLAAWDKFAPGYVAQGCLFLAIRETAASIAQELINKDFEHYLDAQ